MTLALVLLVALSLGCNAALAVGLLLLRRRWSAEKAELARQWYEKALGLDRRHDFADSRLDALERRARVDGLFPLLAAAETSGRLDGPRARHLEGRLLELRDEICG